MNVLSWYEIYYYQKKQLWLMNKNASSIEYDSSEISFLSGILQMVGAISWRTPNYSRYCWHQDLNQ